MVSIRNSRNSTYVILAYTKHRTRRPNGALAHARILEHTQIYAHTHTHTHAHTHSHTHTHTHTHERTYASTHAMRLAKELQMVAFPHGKKCEYRFSASLSKYFRSELNNCGIIVQIVIV